MSENHLSITPALLAAVHKAESNLDLSKDSAKGTYIASRDAMEATLLGHALARSKITVPGKSMPKRAIIRPGRNDPCPCMSGLKYKKCCLNKRR